MQRESIERLVQGQMHVELDWIARERKDGADRISPLVAGPSHTHHR